MLRQHEENNKNYRNGYGPSHFSDVLPSPQSLQEVLFFYFRNIGLNFSFRIFLLMFLSLLCLHALTIMYTLEYLQYVLMRTGVQSVGGFKLNAVFKSASKFFYNVFSPAKKKRKEKRFYFSALFPSVLENLFS